MKLGFLMARCRKNSVRDKVIGKKWAYSDTEHSAQTEGGPSRRATAACGPYFSNSRLFQNSSNSGLSRRRASGIPVYGVLELMCPSCFFPCI